MAERRTIHCAIYTRKSSEDGLEQDFNSLDAQREACTAYIASQKNEGWAALPDFYDDGGFSGGTMQRPGLIRLMDDIRAKRVDVIVVYKVDRLTRSLADFAKLVELLDGHGASFVSVTQQFNTTTSMGRLTLNVLLSFAQFEREIAGERIRDKIKASRQKGIWMGGTVPLGYDVRDRALVINEVEADKVRRIFQRYVELRSVRKLRDELEERGIRSHARITPNGRNIGGNTISRGNLYLMLQNQAYIGMAVHKGTPYPGLHEPIVERDLWNRVQAILAENRVEGRRNSKASRPSLLAGILFDHMGERLTPTHANKQGKKYRYYVSNSLLVTGRGKKPTDRAGWRLPASEIEAVVWSAVQSLLNDHTALIHQLPLAHEEPTQTTRVLKTAREIGETIDPVGQVEQQDLFRSLLSRVEVAEDRVINTISVKGLQSVLGIVSETTATDVPGSFEVVVPVRLAKRGVEQKMIVGANVPSPARPDATLTKAVARARTWFEQLKHKQVGDVAEIARRESLPASYVHARLSLAFLAPSIVEAILAGAQPPDLNLQRLVTRTTLARDWPTQRRQLGFER